jgi:hypothetical protein
MRQSVSLPVIVVLSTLMFGGCELIGDIFEAGVWVGALLVVGIIGLVIWIASNILSRG